MNLSKEKIQICYSSSDQKGFQIRGGLFCFLSVDSANRAQVKSNFQWLYWKLVNFKILLFEHFTFLSFLSFYSWISHNSLFAMSARRTHNAL